MSKVITLENLEVFKQECDKVYASKEEIITATVDCSHKYEITGNTGDEHGLAIDDQQMLIKKIQGHSRRKSLNLYTLKPGTYAGVTLTYDNASGIYTFNGTSTGASIPLNNQLLQGEQISFIAEAVSGTKTGGQNDISVMIDDTWIATDMVNTKTLSESISGCWMSTDITYTNYKVKINVVEGTYTKDTMPPFQPYDNTLVNSNNTLISTGRNLVDINIPTINASEWKYLETTTLLKGRYFIKVESDTNEGSCIMNIDSFEVYPSGMRYNTAYWFDVNSTAQGQIQFYSNTKNTNVRVQIRYAPTGSTNFDFEPYKQDVVQAPMLGEFDYYQESKLYKQTSQVITLNGSEEWGKGQTINSEHWRFDFVHSFSNVYESLNEVTTTSTWKDVTENQTWGGGINNFGVSINNKRIYLCNENFTTVDQLKQWLSQNPIQLVYKLATQTIEDYVMPSGMAVYNGGLQIQQGDGLPYTITKQYNLSQKAQILANIEIDREQAKMIDENNQKFNLIPKFSHVDINLPETSMNGTLTEEEFKILQANDLNYIIFNKEIYMLSDKTHTIDTLTYSHVGYENHKHMLKTISVTVSTRAWVLNTTEIMTGDSGSDTHSLLGVWVLNETINYKVSQTKNLNMTFNSDGVRCVSFRLTSDNRILYEQYPIGGSSKTIEVYNPTNKWNTKTPSYRTIQITDISGLNAEEKTTLATFLKANAVKAQDFIIINQPSTATNGILTQEQLTTLQINDLNYIIFANEIYSLNDKTHTADALTYSHVGFENGKHLLKTISITVSTRAWVLNTTSVVDSYEYRMFKINNPSGNISTSIKEIYIYTNKFDTASRFQDFLQNAYDSDMIFAFPCIAITPTDTIINAQIFYDLNIDPSSYFVIFNDKSEYVAHQNLVVVESA